MKSGEPIVQQDITDITIVIRISGKVRTTLGNLIALCAATKTPCALMGVNVHLVSRSRSMEKGKEMKPLKETFAGFHAGNVTVSEITCLMRGEKACECAFLTATVRETWMSWKVWVYHTRIRA